MFGALIVTFPDFPFNEYLSTDAKIVHCKTLEDAIIKIQSGKEHEMNADEELAVLKLKIPMSEGGTEDDAALTLAQRALKKRRLQENKQSAYVNTSFLLPTSNHVERLFSMSKRIFSEKRRRLNTRTLEALLFLKTNRHLWDMRLVATVVKSSSSTDDVAHMQQPADEALSESESDGE